MTELLKLAHEAKELECRLLVHRSDGAVPGVRSGVRCPVCPFSNFCVFLLYHNRA